MKKLLLIALTTLCSCGMSFKKIDIEIHFIDGKKDTLKGVYVDGFSTSRGDFYYKTSEYGCWKSISYVRSAKIIK